MSPALKYHFASDNTSGVCPEAWQALEEANEGYQPSYGADTITAEACETFRQFFETDCDVYFVFNGTAANSLALASLCRSYNSIIWRRTSAVRRSSSATARRSCWPAARSESSIPPMWSASC
jgi:threonine aldolase